MARQWVASGGGRLVLPASGELERRYFALPAPYAVPVEEGFRGIFPALFPSLGGAFLALGGPAGLYLLPALSLVLLLTAFHRLAGEAAGPLLAAWSLALLAGGLTFYGLTFWEPSLALLLLLPLAAVLLRSPPALLPWILAGLAFGFAAALRPEIVLLVSGLLLLPRRRFSRKWHLLAALAAGAVPALLLSAGLERLWNGRWMAPQAGFNLELAFAGMDAAERVQRTVAFFFNAPAPWPVFAAALALLTAATVMLRRSWPAVAGIALLSLAMLLWGWVEHGAFALTGSSQGLLFAWPWLAVTLLRRPGERRRDDPLFLAGWTYLGLIYLLAPNLPGMHWGPRFLLPVMPFLLLRCARVLADFPRLPGRHLTVAATAAFALMFGAASVAALAQRGAATGETVDRLRAADPAFLVVDRWHAGADLAPLWEERDLFRLEGQGDMEEFLLALQERGAAEPFGWLKLAGELRVEDFPLRAISRADLPGKAGWVGEWLTVELADSLEAAWADLYWHAARRRVEAGRLEAACALLQRAWRLDPAHPDRRYDLAVCLGQMGRVQEAVDHLQEVLRLAPDHAPARRLWERLTRP